MARMSRRWRALVSATVIVAMVAWIAPAAFGRNAVQTFPATSGLVTTKSSDAVTTRVSSTLVKAAEKDDRTKLDVLVVVAKGAKKPAALESGLKVALPADTTHEFWAGRVVGSQLAKVATSKGVVYVADNGKRTPPVVPDVKKPTAAQKRAQTEKVAAGIKAATKAGVVKQFADAVNSPESVSSPLSFGGGGGLPTDWFDIGPTHKSAAAWANGFTGAGVKVAVADDGLDFAHPDLQGTWATVDDANSPYNGWPLAFDPFSTYLYALDKYLGSNYIENGTGWFTDTKATLTTASPTFDGRSYVLPETSKSGTYHIGYYWDENLAGYWYGEFPALLVIDENTSGTYDTVIVDLNHDGDFTNDKKMTKSSPISYLDWWDASAGNYGQDGIADLSGGMLYWIADGQNHPPFFGFEFEEVNGPVPVEGNGDMVCMMGALDYDATHGTLCGSNVAGQGVINGPSTSGEYPSFKNPTNLPSSQEADSVVNNGMVFGGGKNAKLVAISDVYYNFEMSTLMAYDFVSFGLDGHRNSGDEIQVMSNSYGESNVDNDEWDYPSRYVDYLNFNIAPNTTFLFSTGNGGPGYGTNAPPNPSTAIGVGASTQMGADGGWDSIDSASQITYGDVIPFSNRGPSAMNHNGPTIVADGAYAAGDVPLNTWGDGWSSWEIWGGTSRSCPVAAGNTALIYQAFKDAKGYWPTYEEARQLLANGATDLNYDTLVQGSGSVNADRSTRLASGMTGGGVQVSPEAWYPGDYAGNEAPATEQMMFAGDTKSGVLTVTNPSRSPVSVNVSDSWLQRTSVTTMTVTLDSSGMSPYDFSRPDKLVDLSSIANTDPDLMVVRAVLPYDQFDPDHDYAAENVIRLLTYDWTDVNENGRLWTDLNENGVVNAGEMDLGEYMRFTYSNATGTSLENRVQKPADRQHTGTWLGLQYRTRGAGPIQVTIEVSTWNHTDMPWLSASTDGFDLAPGESRDVNVTAAVPADAPLGVYEGEYRISGAGLDSVVPVVMTVAGQGAAISYGGANPYDQLMDNGKVFGYTDWGWRAEAGDWRFFDTLMPLESQEEEPSSQYVIVDDTREYWLAHTSWEATPTDLDTLLFGSYPTTEDSGRFGPTELYKTGGSPNANLTAGVWAFNTATGGAEDWVTGELTPGLNKLMIHNVLYDGAKVGASFSGQAGTMTVDGMNPEFINRNTTNTANFDITSGVELPGFEAEGYGLSRPQHYSGTLKTDEDWTQEIEVHHAAQIEISTQADYDLDLYLYRWNGSGWARVASSETGSGNEYIKVVSPADGTYLIDAFGYDVPNGPQPFELTTVIPQGDGITIAGAPTGTIEPGTPIHLTATVAHDRVPLDERDGSLYGVVSFGPKGAPSVVRSNVTVTYPFEIDSVTPADGATEVPLSTPVVLQFSKHVATDTLTPSTVYVKQGGTVIPTTLAYDYATARVTLTPVGGLTAESSYDVYVDKAEVMAADGSVLPGLDHLVVVSSFDTVSVQRPTTTSLTLSTSKVRYGGTVTATVMSERVFQFTSGIKSASLQGIDANAPVALQFKAKGSSTWKTVATGVTDDEGMWTTSFKATKPGTYRAQRTANYRGLASTSPERSLAVKMWVRLWAKSDTSVKVGKLIKMRVWVDPDSAASKQVVTVQRETPFGWVFMHTVQLDKDGKATFWEQSWHSGPRTIRVLAHSNDGYSLGTSAEMKMRWY